MSDDHFTEVTGVSWLGRLGGALIGMLVGLIFFIIAFPLIFWNEGRAVERFKTLQEGSGTVITVSADRVNDANTGKLIHVVGKATTAERLRDPALDISAIAIRLKRSVEMYQWEERTKSETQKKLGGGTETVKTYSYDKIWSTRLIRSENFKHPADHHNPQSMPYESKKWAADRVELGAFILSKSLIRKLDEFTPLPLASNTPLPPSLSARAQVVENGVYVGNDPHSPQVGDFRMTYHIVPPADASIVAQQVNNTFEPFQSSAGGTIEMLKTGIHSADAMFQDAQDSNKILTWVLRGLGFIFMFIGLLLLFRPLSIIADVLPIFGSIVGAGTALIAFLLSTIFSMIAIAIAWIVYRPLLGILLLGASVGLSVAIRKKLKQAQPAAVKGVQTN